MDDWIEERLCNTCGEISTLLCSVCSTQLCSEHIHHSGADTNVYPNRDNSEGMKQTVARQASIGDELHYETSYGHCLAKNPYWFIPDVECNTDEELLNWRHALFAVKQGTFVSPEHFFWKVVDVTSGRNGLDGYSSAEESGSRVTALHGYNTTWGMGLSAFSDKINIWEEYRHRKWLLILAESAISDSGFLAKIKTYVASMHSHEHENRKERR